LILGLPLWKTYVNHGALIAGPALTDWRILDPVRQPVTLVINDKRVCDTIGGDSAVDPVRLLVWLAISEAARLAACMQDNS
jgi:2-keto-4-pentenoate hydratase